MATIRLIDRSKTAYTGATLRDQPVGGIQTATASLAEALSARGHRVTVFGMGRTVEQVAGVTWRPLKDPAAAEPADLVITNDRPGLLRGHGHVQGKAVWFHNRVSAIRLIRRFNLWPLLRFRPVAVFLSRLQADQALPVLPFRRRVILPHGVSQPFLEVGKEPRLPGPPVALFASQPYRGLAWLAAVWRTQVRPLVPEARLILHVTKPDQVPADIARGTDPGIVLAGPLPPPQLARALVQARVVTLPGHRDETFCLAAAEATAVGTPIITRGIGALRERVVDHLTGRICPDPVDFGAALRDLLTNDALWLRMHDACRSKVDHPSWDQIAERWENAFGLSKPAV